MKCDEFREKMIDFICEKNHENSSWRHMQKCSSCENEYKKYQEISSMVLAMRTTPSKNFTKNLYKSLHRNDASFWEKLNFVLDYAIYRFIHTPLHAAWMSFLIITTITLPICYFSYIENQIHNQAQALPLWKMPAKITINK